MLRQRFDFTNDEGHTLSGRLEEPYDDVRGHVLFAHCFTCSKDVAAATRISRALVDHGFGVLRFDFTGLGNSEGDFANTNFSSNVRDLDAGIRALDAAGKAPQVLVGHSLGGAAVLAAAGRHDAVKAVVTIAAPSDPGHVAHLFASHREQIERDGEAEVTLAGRKFTIAKQLLDDIAERTLVDEVRRMGKSLLILHGPTDELVSIDHARTLFEAARHPKSFVSLDDADHLLTRPRDSAYAAQVIAAWASRYLPEPAEERSPTSEQVRVTSLPKLAQRLEARHHVVRSDEPKKLGGDDTGVTPYELLLGALGSCTSMTMRMYAARKQWPLERVEVELRHDRVHGRDAPEAGSDTPKRSERITRTIRIEGELDDEQRARLMEIANRCPVHRTIEACPEIVTEALGAEPPA
jgi:putative redox protein